MVNKDSANIILGIDPGTLQMGYSVIKIITNKPELLSMGTVLLSSKQDMYVRLQKIHTTIQELIILHKPQRLAIEAPFYSNNVQSMLKLGRAQGIAIAVAMHYGIEVTEYSPRKIKQSVTGNGNASKEQVWKMLQNIFLLKETPRFLDASDALAVAMCHFHQLTSVVPTLKTKDKGWTDFIASNPHKIIK